MPSDLFFLQPIQTDQDHHQHEFALWDLYIFVPAKRGLYEQKYIKKKKNNKMPSYF